MNLLVISDTHGRPDRIREALNRQVCRPDALIFLGDGLADLARCDTGTVPVYSVRGNCDAFTFFDPSPPPEERLLEFVGFRILMTHGHNLMVKRGLSAAARYAASRSADLFLYGHTHAAREERIPAGSLLGDLRTVKPLVLFNPGAASGYGGSFGTVTLRGRDIICGIGEF